jgi:hypothetical protein
VTQTIGNGPPDQPYGRRLASPFGPAQFGRRWQQKIAGMDIERY